MSTYRSVIVGARRGLHHARAYEGVEGMQVVALCENDRERLEAGARALGVKGYAEYEQMLDEERPDVVHAVTSPAIPRAVWVEPAAAAGVQVLVVEKPIAEGPRDAEALREAQQKTGLKVIVNHQRRYMPFADKLRELQGNDSLGPVHFVRASTQGDLMDMSTHLMDLVLLAVQDVRPVAVWGAAEGRQGDDPNPRDFMATYTFAGGARALFESAVEALGTSDYPGVERPPYPYRGNIDVWCRKGRFWWRENGSWGYHVEGMAAAYVRETDFPVDDMPAQTAFTQAIATWLDDETRPHSCRLEVAVMGYDALMGGLRSVLHGRRLEWPMALSDTEWEKLRVAGPA